MMKIYTLRAITFDAGHLQYETYGGFQGYVGDCKVFNTEEEARAAAEEEMEAWTGVIAQYDIDEHDSEAEDE